MEKWNDIKKLITLNKHPQWTDTAYAMYHNFDITASDAMAMCNGGNAMLRNAWAYHAGVLERYDVRKDYNNVVSIKLVMPVPCQAGCRFCFNRWDGRNERQVFFPEEFEKRYLTSLGDIVSELYGKHPISLDITGGEPTFNIGLLTRTLNGLKQSRWLDKINRVVLTTNGYQLDGVLKVLRGVVNYVNISTHHYDYEKRQKIFGTTHTPDDDELRTLVMKLLRYGIRTSTVAVIDEPVDDFQKFLHDYLEWAKWIGFESVRFRGDCSTDRFAQTFNKYIDETAKHYRVIQEEHTPDSHWCRLVDSRGYFFFMLQGVSDTYEHSRGVEYIIADDGHPYLDYAKRHSFYDNELPVEYIFDRKIPKTRD